MPVPFDITLQSGYVLVTPTDSVQGLVSSNNIGLWGVVMQVPDTIVGISVGDVVFFAQNEIPRINTTEEVVYYMLIKSENIIFIEAAV